MTIGKASFRKETLRGIPIVHVVGEVDIANDADFKAELQERAAGADTIVAVLSGVSYLDSQAIATIFDTAQRMALNRRSLLVVAPQGRPAGKLLRIVGIDSMVPTFETVEEAVEHAKLIT